MSQEGIDAVTAIANEDPKRIGIWVSSTPTGKRGFFYNVCTNPDTGYKAYHFPSTVNPDFDERMEGELRATMTVQGYIHEVKRFDLAKSPLIDLELLKQGRQGASVMAA